MENAVTRLEILTLLLAIRALLKDGKVEQAMEIIDEVIAEARKG